LVDTARLRNGVTSEARGNRVLFGTNTKYAGPHQFGARIKLFGKGKKRKLEARPFLPIVKTGNRFGLMTTGHAGTHWAESKATIAKYIRTGIID
jgi:phage gpG-like protein